MNNLNRIVLGTAQFQNGYGITKKEIINPHKVLNIAHKLKIKFLDTSPLYGKSENKIGKINFKFNIISKIPRIKNHKIDAQKWVIKNTKQTLKDLKQKRIDFAKTRGGAAKGYEWLDSFANQLGFATAEELNSKEGAKAMKNYYSKAMQAAPQNSIDFSQPYSLNIQR